MKGGAPGALSFFVVGVEVRSDSSRNELEPNNKKSYSISSE